MLESLIVYAVAIKKGKLLSDRDASGAAEVPAAGPPAPAPARRMGLSDVVKAVKVQTETDEGPTPAEPSVSQRWRSLSSRALIGMLPDRLTPVRPTSKTAFVIDMTSLCATSLAIAIAAGVLLTPGEQSELYHVPADVHLVD